MRAALIRKLASHSLRYRNPMLVTTMRIFPGHCKEEYYICPRCNTGIEREFTAYCDRCGQCLDWRGYKGVAVVR